MSQARDLNKRPHAMSARVVAVGLEKPLVVHGDKLLLLSSKHAHLQACGSVVVCSSGPAATMLIAVSATAAGVH